MTRHRRRRHRPDDDDPPARPTTTPPTTTTTPPTTTTTRPLPTPADGHSPRSHEAPVSPPPTQADTITSHGGTEVDAIPALRLHVVEVPADSTSTARAGVPRPTPTSARSPSTKHGAARAARPIPRTATSGRCRRSVGKTCTASSRLRVASTLAVLDTGVDASTPDLAGRVTGGWSFDGSDPATDANGHGTHVATIAAAGADDGNGIAGRLHGRVRDARPCPRCRRHRTGQRHHRRSRATRSTTAPTSSVMAFSNPGESPALQAAVDYAWSHGVVVIAAAGNDGSSSPTYPAGLSKVVGVGATDESDAVWAGSNQSGAVFIAAPGVSIAASDSAGVTQRYRHLGVGRDRRRCCCAAAGQRPVGGCRRSSSAAWPATPTRRAGACPATAG